jgi:hypothetical protein
MDLVVVELDATEYAEAAGAELGSGHDRWMERGHNGRCESARSKHV